jgi:dTDP-4-dehydrorhamnose reductase
VHGNSFVKTILRLAREKDELRVVADQVGCPTWAGELADALAALAARIEKDRSDTLWGTYHFCGSGIATWYDFAQAIVQEAAKWERLSASRVTPITTADYPTPAKRPKWSVLDCTKIERVFAIRPKQWRQGLGLMLKKLYSASGSE